MLVAGLVAGMLVVGWRGTTPRLGLSPRMVLLPVLAWWAGAVLAWGRRRLRRFLAASGLLVVALAGAEIGLRQLEGPHRPSGEYRLFQWDTRLGWRLRPGAVATVVSANEFAVEVRIGRHGFRGPPPASGPRIAVLGDSFTANFGVPQGRVFTSLLQDQLGGGCQVLNLGVPGYGQTQQLVLLDEVLPALRPSRVLVVLYIRNDLDDNTGTLDAALGIPRPQARLDARGALQLDNLPVERPLLPAFDNLCQVLELASCSVRWLEDKLVRRSRLRAAYRVGPPAEARIARRRPAEPERRAVAVTAALLARMAARCADAGAEFGVVLAPTQWQTDAGAWRELVGALGERGAELDRREPQRQLAAALTARRIAVLDLWPAFASSARQDLYYPWDSHWTAAGNELAAAEISRWLRARR